MIARNVVRTIFRLRTNKRSPTNSVGGDVPDAPQRCPLYLSASTDVRTYQEPSPAGEGGSRRLTDEVFASLSHYLSASHQQTVSPLNPVGTGVLDCPPWKKVTFVSKRTVRQLFARTPCPYNKWGGDLVRRHIVLFVPFVFAGRRGRRPLQ